MGPRRRLRRRVAVQSGDMARLWRRQVCPLRVGRVAAPADRSGREGAYGPGSGGLAQVLRAAVDDCSNEHLADNALVTDQDANLPLEGSSRIVDLPLYYSSR